jgi:methyltransferase
VKEGIYRFTKHPNYFVVVIEIALVPLLGQAYATAILFSAANGIFLWQRIKTEEHQLQLARGPS